MEVGEIGEIGPLALLPAEKVDKYELDCVILLHQLLEEPTVYLTVLLI